MQYDTVPVNDARIVCRHNGVRPDRPTILMIHGLGESSLSFQEAFEELGSDFNLIAPDLLGYGRSTPGSDPDYSLDAQIQRIHDLIAEMCLQDVVLVGHSMGGDLATLACQTDPTRIRKLVNVEGDLTPHDIFISSLAVAADYRGEFLSWLRHDFQENRVLQEWGTKWKSCRRYYASLCFCQPEAFRVSAHGIVARNKPRAGREDSEVGEIFGSLELPKVFCWGSESLHESSRAYLSRNSAISNRCFNGAFHWPMIDQPTEFYRFLRSVADP